MTVERPTCDAWTETRYGPRPFRRLLLSHRCPNPARFRVRAAEARKVPWGPEQPCRRHVRPYLMDNGDSVRKPWIVEAIS